MIDLDAQLGLDPDPESTETWEAYLEDFRTFYYPTYKKFGFTFPEAVSVWQQNLLRTKLCEIASLLRDNRDPC